MIYFIIALLAGIIAGTFTGLVPGIHINLISAILVASLLSFESTSLIYLVVFVVALSITHTFIDFIPSVYLGAPDEDTFLTVLPGHEMMKNGLGYSAIILTLYGSLTAIIVIAIFTPIFLILTPIISEKITSLLPFLLIFVSTYMISREKNPLKSSIIFLLAGILGYSVLNLPIKQPLLPLLTGLFGSSSILISINQKTKIPKQEIKKLKEIKIPKADYLKATIGSMISAPLSSFMPGLGSGQAAIISSEIISQSREGFILMVGAINTIVMGLSFVTLYTIGKTRTGSAVATKAILKEITKTDLTIIFVTILLTSIISFILAIQLAKTFSKIMQKVNYTYLSILILLTLLTATIIFSNIYGIIVLITSTALGIFTILSNSRRINLMGCLLIPTILYYLFT